MAKNRDKGENTHPDKENNFSYEDDHYEENYLDTANVMEGGGDGDDLLSFSTENGGVTKVGNIDYAVGLFWQPIEDANKSTKEAKRISQGEGIGVDFYSHPFKGSLQVGLGSKESGHKVGMPSLAAHLLNSLGVEENWIAIFNTDGAWYVIACHGQSVLAKTDRIFVKQEDAIDIFTHYYQASDDWSFVFAPESFGYSESDHTALEDLLYGKPSARLRAINTKPIIIKGVATAVGIALLALSFPYISPMFFDTSEPDFSVFDAPHKSEQTKDDHHVGIGTDVRDAPWSSHPTSSSVIVACSEVFDDIVFDYPGWKLESISCDKFHLSLNLNRNGGTINWLEPYLRDTPGMEHAVVNIVSPDNIFILLPTFNRNTIPTGTETVPLSDSSFYLTAHLDELNHAINISKTKLTEEYNINYQALQFSFESTEEPLKFISLLSRIPALVVENIQFHTEDHTWAIEGKLYEKRDEPLSEED